MTKADGPPRIDAVEVGELSFVTIGPPTPLLSVKYAYANAESGDRFGYGNMNQGWSEETLDLLSQLTASVERDIVRHAFGEGTTSSSVSPSPGNTIDGVPTL